MQYNIEVVLIVIVLNNYFYNCCENIFQLEIFKKTILSILHLDPNVLIIIYFNLIFFDFFHSSASIGQTMSAWHIFKFGGTNELTFSKTRKLPVIDHPQDILVEVHAASVNPVDTLIMGLYTVSS